jgi:peptidoglycan/xylan/chitin deacetylase (PgdA/CDA1 family)
MMRFTLGLAAAFSLLTSAAAFAQSPGQAAPAPGCAGNPNALGTSRVVEIDTTGGPGFGFEHFNAHDFLAKGEIVLTFDDGPWPNTTPAVLEALAAHCTKATFFAIGQHAMWHPEILKQVVAQGHTVGSHTWSHKDLSKMPVEMAKAEFEKGFSGVKRAAGVPTASFFRFPSLKHPQEIVNYVGSRNIAIFSTDIDSFDFTMRKPDAVVKAVMKKLEKKGKGMLLMHDFQQATSKAVPDLLRELKAAGYKVVHMKSKDQARTVAEFDEQVLKETKGPVTGGDRPTSSVVKTISGSTQ